MASKQTEELNKLYLEWVTALKANPEMPLDELRHMFEQWERITGEPGGVDYIETDAGGVPAMWAAPKSCAQDPFCSARMAAVTRSARCTLTARSTPIRQRR